MPCARCKQDYRNSTSSHSRKRGADQGGNILRAGLAHDGGAVVVDGALADAEVGGDVLAWMSGQDEIEDLALPSRQAGNARRGCILCGGPLPGVLMLIESAIDTREQFFAANRLLNEIDRPGLHRLDRHPDISVAGDHDRGEVVPNRLETLDDFDAAHSRHQRIDKQASLASGLVGIEEGLAVGEYLDGKSIVLEQVEHHGADTAVVIDDKDGG